MGRPRWSGKGVFVVDAQVAEHRGPQVVGREGPVLRVLALGVGRADDLAGPHAAAGDEHAHRLRPVVAAGLHDAGLRAVE